mmetsp:Transcript_19522/g.1734  ORF Transcript_19522/g.1734 Transcript_19522/m.1734 type:complete len:84 (-) Transcript_19522:45-296(-)
MKEILIYKLVEITVKAKKGLQHLIKEIIEFIILKYTIHLNKGIKAEDKIIIMQQQYKDLNCPLQNTLCIIIYQLLMFLNLELL